MMTRSARQAFKSAMGREPGRVHPFTQPIAKKQELPAEALFHFWHPGRDGVEHCPEDFTVRLHEVSPELECVRPPARAPIRSICWLVWWKCPRITHRLSPGWLMILAWHTPSGSPLPLDNRVLANLYLQSAQVFGNGKAYFDSILKNMKSEKDQQQKDQQNYRHDRARDLYQSQQISSAGRGNRFALHHDGTILPSRGEQAWRNTLDLLPSDIKRQEKESAERRRG